MENGQGHLKSTTTTYRIRVKGHLSSRGATRFEGLTINLESDGNSLLSGPIVDQAMLHGIFKKLRDLGITLISVDQVGTNQERESKAI